MHILRLAFSTGEIFKYIQLNTSQIFLHHKRTNELFAGHLILIKEFDIPFCVELVQ